MPDRNKFRIISGGLDNKTLLSGLPVSVITDDHSSLEVDAIVCEEDRFLTLTNPTVIREQEGHPTWVIDQAPHLSPLAIGSVQVHPGSPKRFMMIIHDLDRSPTCRPIWILAAMSALKEELMSHPDVKTLAMPLLGTQCGILEAKESLNLLRQALTGSAWHLERLVLMVPAKVVAKVSDLLKYEPA